MVYSTRPQKLMGKRAPGYTAAGVFEPISTQEKATNLQEYLLTRAAVEAGMWKPGDELIRPALSEERTRKRKREATAAGLQSSSPLASPDRPKRQCRPTARSLESSEWSADDKESEGPALKKRKTPSASPASSSTSPPPPTPPRPSTKSPKTPRKKTAAASPKRASPQSFSERELAWIHQLKTEAGKARNWQDIAEHMNAIQSAQRTHGAYQASYSRHMSSVRAKNGGAISQVYTAQGPHAPVPAMPQ